MYQLSLRHGKTYHIVHGRIQVVRPESAYLDLHVEMQDRFTLLAGWLKSGREEFIAVVSGRRRETSGPDGLDAWMHGYMDTWDRVM